MKQEHPTRILIIEDDLKLAKLISTYLAQHHFEIRHAEDGQQGIMLAKSTHPHLIILDLMMPRVDGLTVCRELRHWYKGRILILTASDEDMDQVVSLEMGADDFISKPVHPRVLLARIRVLMRRKDFNDTLLADVHASSSITINKPKCHIIQRGNMTLNKARRQVILEDKTLAMTDAEFDLLWLLASKHEQILSRDDILKATKGIKYDGLDRSIDNRIASLRRKLGDNQRVAKRIITVRGKGYLFVVD